MIQQKSSKRKEKNYWLTGVLFLLLLGSGAASLHYLYKINKEFKVVLNHEIPITEMISQITVHKLEQTSWLERALRHAEVAAHGQQNDEENTRLLNISKVRFQELTVKVNGEIDTASNMSMEAQKLAQEENMRIEFRRIEDLLISIREEYADYIKRVKVVFELFLNGKISDATQVANEIEKIEEDFNQRLESFMFETEKITRSTLLNIGEREGKAIIVIAIILSIALLVTIVALFLNSIHKDKTSRHRFNRTST